MAFSYCETLQMKTVAVSRTRGRVLSYGGSGCVAPAALAWLVGIVAQTNSKSMSDLRHRTSRVPHGSEEKPWEPLTESTGSSPTARGGSAPSLNPLCGLQLWARPLQASLLSSAEGGWRQPPLHRVVLRTQRVDMCEILQCLVQKVVYESCS